MSERSRLRRSWLVVLGSAVLSTLLPLSLAQAQQGAQAKYVFLMIGDGMGPAQRMAGEIFLSGELEPNKPVGLKKLVMNTFPVLGAARTNPLDELVTDSAAAATAFATGNKARNGVLSLDTDSNQKYPSLAEIARQQGWKVGIVTSAPIDDATPAAFYAHQHSRMNVYEIATELGQSGFDFFGGGFAMGTRPSGLEGRPSPIEAARKNGYTVVTDRQGLLALKSGAKAWAYWIDGNRDGTIYYEMDRPKDQPSLPEFTRKGIELVDNPKGFFMMIEGGEIDGACHVHDLAAAVGETLIFDQAIAVVMEFYKKHPQETLVVITNDHETGGMGLIGPGKGRGKNPASLMLLHQRVSAQKGSQGIFNRKVAEFRDKKTSFEDALPAIKDFFGFEELSPYDAKLVENAYAESMKDPNANLASRRRDEAYTALYGRVEPLSAACCNLLSRQAGVGWTTYGHSDMPAPVSAIGVGSEQFSGYYENTDIFKKILSVMTPKAAPVRSD
jgi:alkaline phosphatase